MIEFLVRIVSLFTGREPDRLHAAMRWIGFDDPKTHESIMHTARTRTEQ